jgi:hypothetical protein
LLELTDAPPQTGEAVASEEKGQKGTEHTGHTRVQPPMGCASLVMVCCAEIANEGDDDSQHTQERKQPLWSSARVLIIFRLQPHAKKPGVRKGGYDVRHKVALKVVSGDEDGVADEHAVVHEAAAEAEYRIEKEEELTRQVCNMPGGRVKGEGKGSLQGREDGNVQESGAQNAIP